MDDEAYAKHVHREKVKLQKKADRVRAREESNGQNSVKASSLKARLVKSDVTLIRVRKYVLFHSLLFELD